MSQPANQPAEADQRLSTLVTHEAQLRAAITADPTASPDERAAIDRIREKIKELRSVVLTEEHRAEERRQRLGERIALRERINVLRARLDTIRPKEDA